MSEAAHLFPTVTRDRSHRPLCSAIYATGVSRDRRDCVVPWLRQEDHVMTTVGDAQGLQFETAIPRESAASELAAGDGVTCRTCQRAIADEYFDINGQPVCAACRD